MVDPQVLTLGMDLFALGKVDKLANINEKKTFRKDKLISNSYNLEVNNQDDFFSVNNNKSPFKDLIWLYKPITIIDRREIIIWTGIITGIDRDHNTKKAVIKSKNSLFKFRKQNIEYTSADWETGASAFKNIADNIGFTDYDNASVQKSIDNLTSNSKLKVNITKDNNMTFQAIAEKLGEYTNSDVYSHNGQINFVHWQAFDGTNKTSLNEKDLKTLPKVTELEKEIINDYRIGYHNDDGTPATDANSNNIGVLSRTKFDTQSLPEMQSDTGRQISFENKAAAVYIGESYIRRTHKNLSTQPEPLTRIEHDLFSDQQQWIDLNTFYKLTLSDESWTGEPFEIFEFTINEETDNIKLISVEAV